MDWKAITILIVGLATVLAKNEYVDDILKLLDDPNFMIKLQKRLGTNLKSDIQVADSVKIPVPDKRFHPYQNHDSERKCSSQMYAKTIIRTDDSRKAGAKYLKSVEDIPSNDGCIQQCCDFDGCDLSVYKNKSERVCYLFKCRDDLTGRIKCQFDNHADYISNAVTFNKEAVHSEINSENEEHTDEDHTDKDTQPKEALSSTEIDKPPPMTEPNTEKHDDSNEKKVTEDDQHSVKDFSSITAGNTDETKNSNAGHSLEIPEVADKDTNSVDKEPPLQVENTGSAEQPSKVDGGRIDHNSMDLQLSSKDNDQNLDQQESSEVDQTGHESSEVDQTGQDSSEVIKTGQDSSEVTKTGQDSSEVDQTGQDGPKVDQTGQDDSKVVETGQDGSKVLQTDQDSSEVAQTGKEKTGSKTQDKIAADNKNTKHKELSSVVIEEDDRVVVTKKKIIVASPTDDAQGPIVALSLGLAFTLMLLVFVGCRLRNVRRRLRKGRPLHHNEADYLINGMYL